MAVSDRLPLTNHGAMARQRRVDRPRTAQEDSRGVGVACTGARLQAAELDEGVGHGVASIDGRC